MHKRFHHYVCFECDIFQQHAPSKGKSSLFHNSLDHICFVCLCEWCCFEWAGWAEIFNGSHKVCVWAAKIAQTTRITRLKSASIWSGSKRFEAIRSDSVIRCNCCRNYCTEYKEEVFMRCIWIASFVCWRTFEVDLMFWFVRKFFKSHSVHICLHFLCFMGYECHASIRWMHVGSGSLLREEKGLQRQFYTFLREGQGEERSLEVPRGPSWGEEVPFGMDNSSANEKTFLRSANFLLKMNSWLMAIYRIYLR